MNRWCLEAPSGAAVPVTCALRCQQERVVLVMPGWGRTDHPSVPGGCFISCHHFVQLLDACQVMLNLLS